MFQINGTHLLKYLIMIVTVTLATRYIPSCGVLQKHAIYVGLVSGTAFALLDTCYPRVIVTDNQDQSVSM